MSAFCFALLGAIVDLGPISAYTLRKQIEEYGRKTNYKNIHQSVKKLEELKLAKLAEVEKGGHAAKKYILSESGWGFVILHPTYMLFTVPSILKMRYSGGSLIHRSQFPDSFRSSSIYRELIEPYFEKNTIKMMSEDAFLGLVVYLKKCIEGIKDYKGFESECIVKGSVTASFLKEIARTSLVGMASLYLGDDDLYEEDELGFKKALLSDKKFHAFMKTSRARLNEVFESYEEMYSRIGENK